MFPALAQRVAALHMAQLLHRDLPHGVRPTALHVKVFFRLASFHTDHPSHRQLANAAGCVERSVRNALRRFRDIGLLLWQHQRRLRDPGVELIQARGTPYAGVWQRLANRYLLNANFLLARALQIKSLALTSPRQTSIREIEHPLPDRPVDAVVKAALMAKYGLAID